MANYATLKAAISQVIKENGNKEITGAVMQTTLLAMVDSMAGGYTFVGVATPSTSAGTPDENVFWIGGAGSYNNFGATTINVPNGCICIFTYNGSFSSNILDLENYYEAPTKFEYGGIDGTGTLVENNVRVRSLPVSVNIGEVDLVCHIPDTLEFVGAFGYNNSTFVKGVVTTFANNTLSFTNDGTFNNIRFVFKRPNGSEISITELNACQIDGILLKDKVQEISDKIDIMEPAVMKNTNDIADIEDTVYIEDAVDFEYGGIDSSNGNLVATNLRVRSLPISFDGQGYITRKLTKPTTINAVAVVYAYNGTSPVKELGSSVLQGETIAFFADGTFDNIIVSLKHQNDSAISQAELDGCKIEATTIKEDVDNLSKSVFCYKGLKYCALGDSITYGFIPRNATGYPGQLNSYAKLTAEALGMTFENYGMSGTTLANTGSGSMVLRYVDMPNDADVITVMGGTNDIRNGVPLGQMTDRVDTTFYGALHVLFQGLYTKYIGGVSPSVGKKKKVIAITPIKLLDATKSHLPNTIENNADILYPNFDKWVDAVKEVAAFYSIPCLDFYNLSGINPHLDRTLVGTEVEYTGNYNPYITDGTHPTQEGQEIMSKVLGGFLKTLV